MAEHGTRQCYADGCRRPECKAAQAIYRRDLKARNVGANVTSIARPGRRPKGAEAPAPITMRSAPQQDAGPNEQAVLDELATLTSAETRKAAAQAAITLAQIADNPLEPGASRKGALQELVKIVADLRGGSQRRVGRLASVQAMTKATGT